MKIILRGGRRHFLSIVGGFLIVFLSACGGGGDDIDSSASADRTLLVYMVESDLAIDAQKSLDAMTKATLGTRLNLVVTTGAGRDVVDGVDWSHTQRWFVGNGQKTKLADLGQQDMTKPDTLRDFLVWGIRNYPAKRYAVVLNDHGGGYRGFGFVGESAHLSLTDLVSAFDGAKNSTGASFDLIGFDACMMASVEVAAALQPYGRYLAASEDLEYGGWDYKSILSGLASTPDLDGLALGKLIADTYSKSPDRSSDYTFSVTDLQQIPPLVAALNNFGSELKSGNYSVVQMAKIRSEAQSFSTDWMRDTDVVDLVQLSKGMTNGLKPAMVTSDAVIAPLVKRAAIYRVAGAAREGTGGLNIFMPAGSIYQPGYLKEYASLKQWMGAYQDFIGQYAETLALSLNVAIDLTEPFVNGGVISSNVTFPDYWNSASPLALISYFDGKNMVFATHPVDAASAAVIDGVSIDPSLVLAVKRNVADGIYAIGGVPVSLIPAMTPNSEYPGRYVIPVKKTERGVVEFGFLLVSEDEGGSGLVVTHYVSSLGGAVGHAISVKDFSEVFGKDWVINMKYWHDDSWADSENQMINSSQEQWRLKKIPVPSANYDLSFAVADFANRLHVSPACEVPTSSAGPTQARVLAIALSGKRIVRCRARTATRHSD